MSDDTPTERFDAPTEPLPKTAESADGEAAAPEERQKRGLLIALLAVAGAILIALIVLIIALLGSNAADDDLPEPEVTTSETPTPTPEETESPEPTEEPSEEPSDEPSATAAPPPPPPQSPSFATFSGPNKAACPDTSSSVQLTWSWSSSNATGAWFGIGTQNAKAEPFESVPTTATYSFNYQCSEASQIYTVTLEDSSGRLTHKTVTVTRQ
jgi:flagellar basal body-associated protein FliL